MIYLNLVRSRKVFLCCVHFYHFYSETIDDNFNPEPLTDYEDGDEDDDDEDVPDLLVSNRPRNRRLVRKDTSMSIVAPNEFCLTPAAKRKFEGWFYLNIPILDKYKMILKVLEISLWCVPIPPHRWFFPPDQESQT